LAITKISLEDGTSTGIGAAARSRIAASIETGTGRGKKSRIELRLRRIVLSGQQGPDQLVDQQHLPAGCSVD
jgi:hypothetical protein